MSTSFRDGHQKYGSLTDVMIRNRRNNRNIRSDTCMKYLRYVVTGSAAYDDQSIICDI